MRDRTGEVWEFLGTAQHVVYLILSSRSNPLGFETWHEGVVLSSDDPYYHEGSIESRLFENSRLGRSWGMENTLVRLA